MSRIILAVFLLVVLVFVLSFTVNNNHIVELNYYVGTVEVPLALLLVVTLSIGAILGFIASLRPLLSSRMEVARLKRSVKLSSQEVENLRSLPVKER